MNDYRVTDAAGLVWVINKVSVEITEEGSLVFRNSDGWTVEAYSPTGWRRMWRVG